MTLYEKIISIYPELRPDPTKPLEPFAGGFVRLQNDADGRGDYIAKWEHPTLPKPTAEQLA